MTKRVAILMNCYVWLQSCLTSLVAVLLDGLAEYYGQPGNSCGLKWESKRHFGFTVFTVTINFVIPALIITMSNVSVFLIARKQQQRVAKDLSRSHGVRQEIFCHEFKSDNRNKSTAEVDVNEMSCPLETVDEKNISDRIAKARQISHLKDNPQTLATKSLISNENGAKEDVCDLSSKTSSKKIENKAGISSNFAKRKYDLKQSARTECSNEKKIDEKITSEPSSHENEFLDSSSELMSCTVSVKHLNSQSKENECSVASDRETYLAERTKKRLGAFTTDRNENQCEVMRRESRYLFERTANTEAIYYSKIKDEDNVRFMVLKCNVAQDVPSNRSQANPNTERRLNSSQNEDFEMRAQKRFSVSEEQLPVVKNGASFQQDATSQNMFDSSEPIGELNTNLIKRRCRPKRSTDFEIFDENDKQDKSTSIRAKSVREAPQNVPSKNHVISKQPDANERGQRRNIKLRNSNSFISTDPGSSSSRVSNLRRVRSKEFVIALSTLILAMTFLITWLPFIVSRVSSLFIPQLVLSWRLSIYTGVLTILTSTLNPYIIFVTRRDIRKELFRKVYKQNKRESVVSSFAQ